MGSDPAVTINPALCRRTINHRFEVGFPRLIDLTSSQKLENGRVNDDLATCFERADMAGSHHVAETVTVAHRCGPGGLDHPDADAGSL